MDVRITLKYIYFFRFKWKKIAFMYEREDLNELAGTRSCQLMLSSVIEFVKTDMTTRDDGDIQLAKVTYRQYFLNSVGTNYASKYLLFCA